MKNLKFILPTALAVCISACATHQQEVSLAPPHAPLIEGKVVPVVAHSDIASLLDSKDQSLADNKRLVFDMWRTVLNAGHVEAIDSYYTPDYIEHSQTGMAGLRAFKSAITASVNYQAEVPLGINDPLVTIIAENDYVAVASVAQYLEPDGSGNTYTSSYFDLFRIENNRIAEHWDSSQISKGVTLVSDKNGGPSDIIGLQERHDQFSMLQSPDYRLANNKRLVFDLWRHTSESGRQEMAELYLDPIYIQHNPNAATGREGFMEYFSKRPKTNIETQYEAPLITIIAEGDMVVQALQGERPDPNDPEKINVIAWFDMFRVKHGRLIEHWDTASKGEVPKIMQDAQLNY